MNRFVFLLLTIFSLTATKSISQTTVPYRVEIVFCLDLSGSTNGLIDRIRDHFWDYTYLLSKCNPQATYRIGVVGFSRPSFKREKGYVKVLKDLTTDMESIGKEIFDLKTSIEKGDQMVGHALLTCGKDISWSQDSSVLRVLFIVGNGLVNQGGTDFRKAAEDLQATGITVNALYCNTRTFSSREVNGWKEIAELGKGYFSTFSVTSKYYASLGDFNISRLHDLNDSLNNTYIYYGVNGKERWQTMADQDRKIYFSNPEGYIFRSSFKISPLYQKRNSSWDLVDLLGLKGDVRPEEYDPAFLPEEFRRMKEEDFKKVVIQNRIERTRLIHEIKTLIGEKEQKETADKPLQEKNMQSFDLITLKILNMLLEKKGYVCDRKPQ